MVYEVGEPSKEELKIGTAETALLANNPLRVSCLGGSTGDEAKQDWWMADEGIREAGEQNRVHINSVADPFDKPIVSSLSLEHMIQHPYENWRAGILALLSKKQLPVYDVSSPKAVAQHQELESYFRLWFKPGPAGFSVPN